MIFCILAKLILSSTAVLLIFNLPQYSIYLQAFLIGIAPIWGEVLATKITKVEPSRETRKSWLFTDAAVDALVFLLAPSLWFLKIYNFDKVLMLPVLLFLLFGIFRIWRFLKSGVDANGYFQGLPVTYTGYQWILYAFIVECNFRYLAAVLIILVSIAMVLNKKIIRTSCL